MKREIIRVNADYTVNDIANAYEMFLKRREWLVKLDEEYHTGQTSEKTTLVVNYSEYISDTKTSYVAGIPPTFTCSKDDDKTAKEIIELMTRQNVAATIQRIVAFASRHGCAYGVCYTDVNDEGKLVPKVVASDALNTFVAYTNTLHPASVFGCIVYNEKEGEKDVAYLDVYDDATVTRYKVGDDDKVSPIGESQIHGFDRVPIIEFHNNPDSVGDFEPIISIQTALNQIVSDRVKDKNRFASATLLAKGVTFGDTREEQEEMMGSMKEDEYIAIPRDADLSYLVKTFDEASVQVLVDDLLKAMFTISRVPDLSDQAFASNASGVAIKFKLHGLNNLAQAMVTMFDIGFTRMCKLYASILSDKVQPSIADMAINFRFDLPADQITQANVLSTYVNTGLMSKVTAMANIPYIDDVDAEIGRLRKQETAEDARQRRQETDFLNGKLGKMMDEDEDDEL